MSFEKRGNHDHGDAFDAISRRGALELDANAAGALGLSETGHKPERRPLITGAGACRDSCTRQTQHYH